MFKIHTVEIIPAPQNALNDNSAEVIALRSDLFVFV